MHRTTFRLPRLTFAVFLIVGLSFPLLAFAQEAAPVPAGEAISLRGQLLTGVASLAGLALTALLAAGAAAVLRKSKDTAWFGFVNRLYSFALTAAAHVDGELRPQIVSSLSDGKITTEEAEALKKRAMEVFRELAGDLLEQAPKILGVPKETIDRLSSGLIERAVKSLKKREPVAVSRE